MHLKRTTANRKLPIQRKGTKYVARALNNLHSGLPVVIAVRDMLKLAKTSKEVKHMVNKKMIKINGKVIRDIKRTICLFSILELGEKYKLVVLPTGKFSLEKTKDKYRVGKIINKTFLKNKKIQLNLHDGTNIISKETVKTGDSVELDWNGQIKNIIRLERGKNVFIFSGKSVGLNGEIGSIEKNKAKIKFKGKQGEVELGMSHIIAV